MPINERYFHLDGEQCEDPDCLTKLGMQHTVGYQYGTRGKIYKEKEFGRNARNLALKQMRAIHASRRG